MVEADLVDSSGAPGWLQACLLPPGIDWGLDQWLITADSHETVRRCFACTDRVPSLQVSLC
jgi:hypothetical protein